MSGLRAPGHEAELAGGDTGELAELSERAVEIAASDLGLNPLLFARELAQVLAVGRRELGQQVGQVRRLGLVLGPPQVPPPGPEGVAQHA